MHIMLAVDDSQYAKAILTWMRRFPHPSGTRITLLHVLELFDVPEEFSAKPGLRQKQRVKAESLLAGAAQELQKAYVDVKVSIVEGFPIYEILRAIREQQPDLVVSGTRGLRAAMGLALGSVSQRLLSYAPCSVMLVPSRPRRARKLDVVLATDGSRGAKEAARYLTLLPDLGTIHLITTVRPVGPEDTGGDRGGRKKGSAAARTQLRQARQAAAKRALEGTLVVLRPSGLPIKTRVVVGHPAEAIPLAAKKQNCDLLVVGSRGLTGAMAIALRSVSLAVAQSAPCAVLVVKRRV